MVEHGNTGRQGVWVRKVFPAKTLNSDTNQKPDIEPDTEAEQI
jgi:hypothetical protein